MAIGWRAVGLDTSPKRSSCLLSASCFTGSLINAWNVEQGVQETRFEPYLAGECNMDKTSTERLWTHTLLCLPAAPRKASVWNVIFYSIWGQGCSVQKIRASHAVWWLQCSCDSTHGLRAPNGILSNSMCWEKQDGGMKRTLLGMPLGYMAICYAYSSKGLEP